MTPLKVLHRTTYRYRELVSLRPHRLMLRPRESRELRLLSMQLIVEPQATITWAGDVSGNMVATAAFQAMTSSLVITSIVQLELAAVSWPVFDVAASALSYLVVILAIVISSIYFWRVRARFE